MNLRKSEMNCVNDYILHVRHGEEKINKIFPLRVATDVRKIELVL